MELFYILGCCLGWIVFVIGFIFVIGVIFAYLVNEEDKYEDIDIDEEDDE